MITLELEGQEVNLLLAALAQMPYGQVYQLVQKIQLQATPQVKKPDAE